MTYFRAIHFDRLFSGSVGIDYQGDINIRSWEEKSRDIKGRVAYLPLDYYSRQSVKECLAAEDNSSAVWPKTGKKLWICKESRIPRALLRNSDYKITIDKENADYIVVPELTDDEVSQRVDDLIYIRTNSVGTSLFYLTFNRGYEYQNSKEKTDEILPKIEAALKEKFCIFEDEDVLELIHHPEYDMTTVYFVKNTPEIEQILTGNMVKDYIVDTRIRITAPTEMTAEALQIWSKMEDGREMMAKAVIASDWQNHPVTTCVFLNAYNLRYYGGEQLRYVQKCVNYAYYERNSTFPAELIVQPEDWNLLQDWLMLRAGMGPEGGFKVQRGEGDTKFIRYAECIKPLHISEPMQFQDIEARLKI